MIRLTRREHWLLVGFAILVASWLSFVFAVRPAIERTETLKRVIPEKQAVLQQLRIKSTQYLAMQDTLHNLKKQTVFEEKGFELIPFLESMFKDSGLIKKITMMKQDVLKHGFRLFAPKVQAAVQNVSRPFHWHVPVWCSPPFSFPFGLTFCAWTLFERKRRVSSYTISIGHPTLKAEFWLPRDDPSFAILNALGFLSEKQGYHLLHVRFVGSIEWAFSGTPIPLSESFVWPTQARIRLLVSGAALQIFCRRGAFKEERKVLTVDHGILYPPCLSHLVV